MEPEIEKEIEKKKKKDYEIGSFDESLKARVVLDVHVMKLDTFGPRERLIKEVIDFLRGDIDDNGYVRSFGH